MKERAHLAEEEVETARDALDDVERHHFKACHVAEASGLEVSRAGMALQELLDRDVVEKANRGSRPLYTMP